MMFWYGGTWAWWQAGLVWLAMIVWWALLAWMVYAMVAGFVRHPGRKQTGDRTGPGNARRILDERLARGEISVEEHQRLHDALDDSRHRSGQAT
jgi:putative membrane protein